MSFKFVYNSPAPTERREQPKARSGSSVWLERSPVTAEVAGSSPVRFVPCKKRFPRGNRFFRARIQAYFELVIAIGDMVRCRA